MTLVPSITTNLELGLQPDSSFWQDSARTTSASSTDPVGAWDDQSGNGNHATQGTTANKPTLDSDDVGFDGTNDYLIADAVGTAIGSSEAVTIYMVMDVETATTGQTTFFSLGDASADVFVEFVTRQPASMRLFVKTDTGVTKQRDAVSGTGRQVVVVKIDSGTIYVYIDGSGGSNTYTGNISNLDQFTIGATRANGSVTKYLTSNVPIVSLYVYSTAHNDTDRGTIEDDLTAEYIDTTQTASPNAIAVTATVQQPSVIGPDQTASPNAIAITATVEQPSVTSIVTASPDSITVTATVQQPTVSTGAVTASPNAIAITATVEQPTVTTGAVTVSPDSIAVTATVEEPTVIGPNQTASPNAIAITATVEQPTVSTAGSLQTASPNAIAVTATVEQPTVTTGEVTASPDSITVTATVEEPTVTTGEVTASPDAIAITATVEQPTVTTGAVTASPDSIAITATVQQPTVTTGAVTANPDAITVTATVEQPSVIGPAQTASPDAIAITATVQQPTVTNIVQGEVYGGSIAVSYPYAGTMGISYPYAGEMAVTYPYSGTIEVA